MCRMSFWDRVWRSPVRRCVWLPLTPLPRSVLAHRFDAPAGSTLLLHNLADTAVTVDIGAQGTPGKPYDLFVDSGMRPDPKAQRPHPERLGIPMDTPVP